MCLLTKLRRASTTGPKWIRSKAEGLSNQKYERTLWTTKINLVFDKWCICLSFGPVILSGYLRLVLYSVCCSQQSAVCSPWPWRGQCAVKGLKPSSGACLSTPTQHNLRYRGWQCIAKVNIRLRCLRLITVFVIWWKSDSPASETLWLKEPISWPPLGFHHNEQQSPSLYSRGWQIGR